jgi:hypothetical protein
MEKTVPRVELFFGYFKDATQYYIMVAEIPAFSTKPTDQNQSERIVCMFTNHFSSLSHPSFHSAFLPCSPFSPS